MPEIRCVPSGARVRVPRGTLLLDAIREAGLPIARACGAELICGRCAVHILEGRVAREGKAEQEAKARNRIPEEQRLACAIRTHDDLVVRADYWGGGA